VRSGFGQVSTLSFGPPSAKAGADSRLANQIFTQLGGFFFFFFSFAVGRPLLAAACS